jgi:hypothetical protein
MFHQYEILANTMYAESGSLAKVETILNPPVQTESMYGVPLTGLLVLKVGAEKTEAVVMLAFAIRNVSPLM